MFKYHNHIISYHNHNHCNHISDEKVGRFFDQVFRVPGTAAWQDAFAKSQGYPGALMATHPLKAGKTWMTSGDQKKGHLHWGLKTNIHRKHQETMFLSQ